MFDMYKGLDKLDLTVTILLTPFLIPFWILGGIGRIFDNVREWWWNS